MIAGLLRDFLAQYPTVEAQREYLRELIPAVPQANGIYHADECQCVTCELIYERELADGFRQEDQAEELRDNELQTQTSEM